ncbi:hypothetical protein ACFVYE_15500 [Streptomyces sp. NPDC058239]|uniref:hypothetical protein n=1 Tax=unclassified Streptomyces TaxID=2593676 RepID=UPI003661D5C9
MGSASLAGVLGGVGDGGHGGHEAAVVLAGLVEAVREVDAHPPDSPRRQPANALTQRHTDLKNDFYDKVRGRGGTPDSE